MRGDAVARRVLLAVVLVAAPASAEDQKEGRTRFQHGVELYKEGDFRAAIIEFKRAYEAAPNYRILYNLAQTELEVQDYAAALAAFKRYLEEGGREIPKDRRAQVDAEIRKLERRVAKVTVRSSVDGAEVLVDDVVVGRTPLSGPLVVSAGRRRITVAKEGQQRTRTLDVAGGDQAAVDLDLPKREKDPPPPVVVAPPPAAERPAPPPPSAPPDEPPRREPARSHTAAYISLGATTALTAGAVVTGLMALSAKNDFTTRLQTQPGARTDIAYARSRTTTLALATDILGGVALAGAVVTVLLVTSGGGGDKSVESRGIGLALTPAAGGDAAGATLRVNGRF
jgi:hypothetical protein